MISVYRERKQLKRKIYTSIMIIDAQFFDNPPTGHVAEKSYLFYVIKYLISKLQLYGIDERVDGDTKVPIHHQKIRTMKTLDRMSTSNTYCKLQYFGRSSKKFEFLLMPISLYLAN